MNKPPRPSSSRLLDAASLRFIVISGTAKAVGGIAVPSPALELVKSLGAKLTAVTVTDMLPTWPYSPYPGRPSDLFRGFGV